MRISPASTENKYNFWTSIRVSVELLSPGEKLRAIRLLVVMLVSAVFEVAGIFSIMPFMALVARPDIAQQNAAVHWVYVTLGFADQRQFLVFAGTSVLVLITLGNALALFSIRQSAFFANFFNHSLSMRLVEACFERPYEFYVREHSSKIGAKVLSEVASFVSGYVRSILDLVARGMVVLLIAAMLVAVNPLLAVKVTAGLAVVYGGISAWFRRRILADGHVRTESKVALFKLIQEVFVGIREVRLYSAEKFFFKSIVKHSENLGWSNTRTSLISQTPRYLVETIAFGSIILVVLSQILAGRNANDIIPIISLYVVAGYRLLPAFQAAFAALTQAQFNANTVAIVEEELRQLESRREGAGFGAQPGERRALHDVIRVRVPEFVYAGTTQPVLRGVDLAIRKNQSLGIIGPTGSGKSTLVDILVGLLPLSQGALEVDGQALTRPEEYRAWQRNVGYVSQSVFMLDDSVRKNIAFGVPDRDIDDERVIRAAKAAQIHEFVCGLELGYETSVGERGQRLSGGQRQRIGIARGLYRDPDVLILDEATSALDTVTEASVMSAIQGLLRTKTIIMVTHRLGTVRDCDQIIYLEGGRVIAQGPLPELVERNEQIRDLWRRA